MNKTNIIKFDVRPVLASGVDPFEAIMEKLKELSDDQTLLVINSFEPVPLFNIIKGKGYEYEVERPEDGVVYSYLKKVINPTETQKVKEVTPEIKLAFEEVETKYKSNMKEIDVRDLEMPMPMVTILEELENMDKAGALYVHHKKLPQYLIPELNDRGYKFVHKEIDNENLKLIIYR